MSYIPPLEAGDSNSIADGLTEYCQEIDAWTFGNWSGVMRLYTVHQKSDGTHWDALWQPLRSDWAYRGTANDYGPAEAMRINTGSTRPFPKYRDATIEIDGNSPTRIPSYLDTGLWLSLAKPPNTYTDTWDVSNASYVSFFVGGKNTDLNHKNLIGTGRIQLIDSSGNFASHEFAFTPDTGIIEQQVKLLKDFITTDMSGNPIPYANFDFTHIHDVFIWFDLGGWDPTNPNTAPDYAGYTAWLDGGPFFVGTTAPSRIAIYARDVKGNSITGKSATFLGPSGSTDTKNLPYGPATCNPGTYTVTPIDSDFVKWVSNDSTTAAQAVIVPVGGLGQDTAVFQSGTIQQQNLLPYVIAGIGIAGIIAYFLLKGGGK